MRNDDLGRRFRIVDGKRVLTKQSKVTAKQLVNFFNRHQKFQWDTTLWVEFFQLFGVELLQHLASHVAPPDSVRVILAHVSDFSLVNDLVRTSKSNTEVMSVIVGKVVEGHFTTGEGLKIARAAALRSEMTAEGLSEVYRVVKRAIAAEGELPSGEVRGACESLLIHPHTPEWVFDEIVEKEWCGRGVHQTLTVQWYSSANPIKKYRGKQIEDHMNKQRHTALINLTVRTPLSR